MADREFKVFRARLDVKIENKDIAIKGLNQIEETALNLRKTLLSLGRQFRTLTKEFVSEIATINKIVDSSPIELNIGPRGGIDNTRKELRAFIKEFESILTQASTPDALIAGLDEIALSIGTTTDQIISRLGLLNKKSAEEWKKFYDTGVANAEALYMELVGNSIIVDLVNEVDDLLSKLPHQAKTNIQDIIVEFNRLKSIAIPDPADLTTKGTPRVGVRGQTAIDTASRLREIQDQVNEELIKAAGLRDIEQFNQGAAVLQSTFRNLFQKTTPEVFDFKRQFTELTQEANRLKKALSADNISLTEYQNLAKQLNDVNVSMATLHSNITAVDDAARGDAINTITQRIERLRKETDLTEKGFLRFVKAGIAAFRAENLQGALVDVRQELFGLSDASQIADKRGKILVRTLDALTSSGIKFAKINSQEQGELIRVAQTMQNVNATANQVVNQIANVAKVSTGEQKAAFGQLLAEINGAVSAYKRLETAASSSDTGAVRQSFQSVNTQVRSVSESLKRLKIAFGDSLGPEVNGLLDDIETDLKSNSVAVTQLARNLTKIEQRLEQPKNTIKVLVQGGKEISQTFKATAQNIKDGNIGEAIVSAAKATRQTVDTFAELRKSAPNVVSSITKSVRETTSGMLRFSDSTRLAATGANLLKDAFSFMLGGLLLQGVNRITGAIGGFVSKLKQDFTEANILVQDFNTTLTQILSGRSEEVVTASLRGANEFIREVIAKTPFELASGQQAFQQLVIAGFDPRDWLLPAADAAAAMNKDMGILINALQRLRAGSKGMAVDMLRDFGIAVQSVGQWTDASGQAIERDKLFRDGIRLTNEELEAAGYAWEQWSFDAAGSLDIDQFKALDILNGYLQQNETFAGASTARSRTLRGVLSNLQDTVTSLSTAFGQPVFQAFTDALSYLLGVVDELRPPLEAILTILGNEIGDRIRATSEAFLLWAGGAETIAEATTNLANKILGTIKPALFVILAFIQGDWKKGWGLLAQYANEGLKNLFEFFRTTGKDAFKWGFDFISMVAKGILNAGKTILKFAVTGITSVISNFLKPGSPPKEGPLSTIDRWGAGLMNTFINSFKEADLSALTTITSTIAGVLQNLGIDEYKGIRKLVRAAIGGINETGRLDETIWDQINAKIGDGNQELKDYVRSVLELKQVEKEYADAEAAGFIPKDLEDRLDAAKVAVALKEEDLKLSEQQKNASSSSSASSGSDEKTDYKKEFQDEKKFLEKKKKLGLINETEYQQQLQQLNEQFAEQAIRAGDENYAKQRIEDAKKAEEKVAKAQKDEQIKQLKERIELEKKILKIKYDKGLITHQEYLKGLIGLEENFIDFSLESGLMSEADSAIGRLKDLQQEYKDLVTPETILPGDTLASFADDVEGTFESLVEDLKNEFSDLQILDWKTVGETFATEWSTIWEGFKKDLFGDFASLGGESDTAGGFFSGLLDRITKTIDEKWLGDGGIKDNITNKISELWDYIVSDDGPLASIQGALDRLADGAAEWVNNPDNKERLNMFGSAIGKAVVSGITTIFDGGAQGTEEVSSFYTNFIKTLARIGDSFRAAGLEVLKGFLESIIGEAAASALTAIIGAELALGAKAVEVLLTPFASVREAIDIVKGVWDQILTISNLFIKRLTSVIAEEGIGGFVERIKTRFQELLNYVSSVLNGLTEIIGHTLSKLADFDFSVLNPFSGGSNGSGNNASSFFKDFLGSFAKGTPKVEQDGYAYLHKDEAVLTKDAAELFRSLLGIYNGAASLASAQSVASVSNSTSNSYVIGSAIFPNVTKASDAKDIFSTIDNMASSSRIKGTVV